MGRSSVLKAVTGTVVIGGVLAGLWLIFGTRTPEPAGDERPAVPRLADTRAVVRVRDGARTQRASISCDGSRRSATGFWARDPAGACDALASTRGALLSGPGCPRIGRRQVGLSATGSFGARRFAHRALRDGCPDLEGWLDVNVLASPVLEPAQELERARGG
jgi:hypothetical protein